jgi:hypothetical protein
MAGVKIALAAARFHGFGVARQGPWVTVGLFVWHAEKVQNGIHQNSKIGSRTHFEAPSLNKPTVSVKFCKWVSR